MVTHHLVPWEASLYISLYCSLLKFISILTSFMGPWVDFIFAKVICRADAQYYTVSIGLWKMLEKEYIDSWYTCFAAGAVVVSIPIAILFLLTQKFYVDGMSGAVKG